MRTEIGHRQRLDRTHPCRRRGSFALEAALTVPVLLVILLFMVSMLLSVQAEMRLKTAVDRTAAEISLLPPVIFSLIDESEMKIPVSDLINKGLSGLGKSGSPAADAEGGGSGADSGADARGDTGSADGTARKVAGELSSQMRAGILSIIQPDRLEALVNDAALDLASSVVFSGLVNARVRYWWERLGRSALLSSPSTWLDWNLKDDQLYLEVDYEVRTLLGRSRRQFMALVPVWRPQEPAKDKPDSESVWKLDNFTRGRKLRERFGGNLPANYPVIARFEAGEALSIKSMDLTRPTYADPQAVQERIMAQVNELAAFQGTAKPFGRDSVWVQADAITARRLLLVVPADSDFNRYARTFASVTRDAASMGVTFEIVSIDKAKDTVPAPVTPAPSKPASAAG